MSPVSCETRLWAVRLACAYEERIGQKYSHVDTMKLIVVLIKMINWIFILHAQRIASEMMSQNESDSLWNRSISIVYCFSRKAYDTFSWRKIKYTHFRRNETCSMRSIFGMIKNENVKNAIDLSVH